MTTQAFNFLWLNLDLHAQPDPEDGSIRQPLPEKYIENVRQASERHPNAAIRLWVDSQRLTEKQMKYLKASIEHERPNVRLMNLRDIEAYSNEKIYNEADSGDSWRYGHGKANIIWRQVDCAKILISLQGKYDQTFFADLDYASLDIDGKDSQTRLRKPGFFIGSGFENQFWGFSAKGRSFFKHYYSVALKEAYKEENAFKCLITLITYKKAKGEIKDYSDISIYIENDGTEAEHPDHVLGKAGNKGEISFIPANTLTDAFNKLPAIEAAQQTVKPEARLSMAWVKATLRRLVFRPSTHKGVQP